MNNSQKRLLLETELHFYYLGMAPTDFAQALKWVNVVKPVVLPVEQSVSDADIVKMNNALRLYLRSPKGLK